MKSLLKVVSLLMLLSVLVVPSAWAQSGTNTYEVTVTNLTDKQVMSPMVIASHSSSMHVWQQGQLASEGVRIVAEDGKPIVLADSLKGQATDVQTTANPLMPGMSVTVRVTANEGDVLSAASMLVQTNDTFTGLDNVALTAGTVEAMGYDAGTEENTELAADIPGPPFMGMNRTATTPAATISASTGIRGDAEIDSSYNWEGAAARFEIRAVTTDMPTGMPQTGRGGDALPTWFAYIAGAAVVLTLSAVGTWQAVRAR